MNFNFQGTDTDFKNILFLYFKEKEGYETKVYKDIYGNPTVGLGHLIKAGDNLSVGQIVPDEKVIQLFHEDYDVLNIDHYIAETNPDNYNQALAIAHFIWGHGDGQYKNSELRQHLIKKDLDYNGMVNYLNNNWDRAKPKNRKVNRDDFAVYYSANPWVPSKNLSYYLNILQTYTNAHPVAVYGVMGSALAIATGLISYGIYTWARSRKK